jgi:hypothetical protein
VDHTTKYMVLLRWTIPPLGGMQYDSSFRKGLVIIVPNLPLR